MSVLLIGLDGTPWSVLKKWSSNGELPTFKFLIDNSISGIIRSTIPTYTCPALPTLFTGKSQGKTGIFGFTYPDGTPVTLNTIKDYKIWNILTINNKSSCIVNVRMLYPVEKINGVMISGNPAPSEESDYVYPPELKKRIYGFRHIEEDRLSEELTKDPQKNKEKILQLRVKMTKNRYNVFKMLNLEKKYDFSFFWIGGTDFMGHWFWDDEETYLRYFKVVDDILNDIIKTFKGWDIIIISDHGMQSVQKRKFYVNTFLEKLGYLKYKGNPLSQFARKIMAPTLSLFLRKEIKNRILHICKKNNNIKNCNFTKRDTKSIYTKFEYSSVHNIDWDSTKAFLINDWGIKINFDKTSKEYHNIRENIINKLKELKDSSGEKVIKEVWRKEEIFNGPFVDALPDIIFITNEKYGLGILPSFKIFGRINKDQYERSGGRFFRGDHEGAIDGILIAYGPNFKKGKLQKKAHLIDIMPTILHMLDVNIPEDVDGEVLRELFNERSKYFARTIKKKDYGKPYFSNKQLKDDDQKAIIKSLEQMGYM